MKMRGMGVAEIETSPFWGHSSPSGLDEDRHTAFRVVVRPWSCVFCSRFYFVALNLTMFSGVQVSTGCGLWWFRVSFIRIPSAIQMFEAGGALTGKRWHSRSFHTLQWDATSNGYVHLYSICVYIQISLCNWCSFNLTYFIQKCPLPARIESDDSCDAAMPQRSQKKYDIMGT